MSKYYKAFNAIKNLVKGGKQKTTGAEVIKSVKPNVHKTKLEKAKSKLAIAKQKTKASQAKLDNTIFRINQQKKRLEREKKMGGGMMDEKTRKEIQKQKVKLGLGVFDEKGNFQAKKRKKMMGGGMMGRRFGMKKGSKFPDLTGDGKVTFADILKGRGVINGKKKGKK